jgi:hypothetical protein
MRFLIFALPFFLLPALVFANHEQTGGIVPCSGGDECDACHLVQLAQNILDFLIIFTVSISAVLFVVAGLMMVTSAGDTGKLSKAKSIFTNVVIGLIIVLAAWLIIDTVMKAFLFTGPSSGSQINIGPWNEILCANSGAAPVSGQANPNPPQPLANFCYRETILGSPDGAFNCFTTLADCNAARTSADGSCIPNPAP